MCAGGIPQQPMCRPADWMPHVDVGDFTTTLSAIRASPSCQFPRHRAWSPWLNQTAKSRGGTTANPARHPLKPGLNLSPGAGSLIYSEESAVPHARALEMFCSFQAITAHLRQLCGSLSLNFPITGSKYCWDSVIARLQPISITDEV